MDRLGGKRNVNVKTDSPSYDAHAADQSYRQNYETYENQDKGFFNDNK